MDIATHLALQAIVRGMHRGRVVDDGQVEGIIEELQSAARAQGEHHHLVDAGELMKLASDIGTDARIGD